MLANNGHCRRSLGLTAMAILVTPAWRASSITSTTRPCSTRSSALINMSSSGFADQPLLEHGADVFAGNFLLIDEDFAVRSNRDGGTFAGGLLSRGRLG